MTGAGSRVRVEIVVANDDEALVQVIPSTRCN